MSAKKPSRKPSVLVSRQFAFTNNAFSKFNNGHSSDATVTTTAGGKSVTSKKNAEQSPPKIIWNGRDATPLPLRVVVDSHNNNNDDDDSDDSVDNLPTLEDIHTLFESNCCFEESGSGGGGGNDDDDVVKSIPKVKVGIPWIPKVMNEFSHSFLPKKKNNNPDIPPNGHDDGKRTIIKASQDCSESDLIETATMEIYSMAEPSTANTSTYYDNIRDRNEQYEKACIRQRKDCPKNFKERSAQTFHLYQIDDATQTETEFKDVGVGNDQADQSDIIAENFVEDMTSATIMTEGSLLDVSDGARPGEKGVLKMNPISKSASYSDIKLIKAKKHFFESNTASQKLSMIERAIQQNIYSTQQIKYRGVEMVNHINQIQKDSSNDKDNLELLFALKCDMTSHMKVTCMSWNKLNRDVLAVGYGSKRNSFCEEGCVMLWSIRNPQYPEKLFKLSSSVTTVDFSSEKAEMMAVGLLDGRVLVFDTASQCSLSSPMLDSAFSPGRHMATVSKLHWVVDRHQGATERLVSISVDGSVLQWSVKKGLSALPLMTLKRSDVHMSKGKLPNIAFGLSMDFAQDNISYLTGSDDGTLYHCSRSYNEHPLSTVRAHTGPLTAIKFSPFLDNVFMTGSSDSSIKIHHIPQKQEGIAERLVIYPANLIGAVNDISWSPNESAIFALAAEDDRMELWDMSKSLLDPIISLSQKDLSEDDYEQKSRTVVQFSNAGDILVVGDDQGCVELYRLHLGKRSKESEHLSQILERLSKPKGFNGDITK